MPSEAITRFREENFFLSNMYVFDNGILTPDNVTVHTSEQLYLAPRLLDEAARLAVEHAVNGFAAKQIYRDKVREGSPIREDWDAVKVEKMRACVAVKFRVNEDLAEKLLATNERMLIEGTIKGDRFWGVAQDGAGLNMMGKILMETRDCLRNSSDCPDFNVSIDDLVRSIFA